MALYNFGRLGMLTFNYYLFSFVNEEFSSEVIDAIYNYGRDIATVFETIEIEVVESLNFEYYALISNKQKKIMLENMDVLIKLRDIIKEYKKGGVFDYEEAVFYGLRFVESPGGNWEHGFCRSLFNTIISIFNSIENKIHIKCNGNEALDDLRFMAEKYLKNLGKESELEDTLSRFSKFAEPKMPFQKEEDIVLPFDEETFNEEHSCNIAFPSTIKFTVRREFDGRLCAITSEDTAAEFSKFKEELFAIANLHFGGYDEIALYQGSIERIFFTDCYMCRDELSHYFYIGDILWKIVKFVAQINSMQDVPHINHINYVTKRHLEEIHEIAQECLKAGLFKTCDKFETRMEYGYDQSYEPEESEREIKDSVQLAKKIDANFKTLDPPTGSKTKPAIHDD